MKVGFLAEYRDALESHFRGTAESGDENKRAINQGTSRAQALVHEAGQNRLIVIQPPPMFGGRQIQIDPFQNVFTDFYGSSVIPEIINMIDAAIGALQHPVARPASSDNTSKTQVGGSINGRTRVVQLCSRFHLVARQLGHRHADRDPFPVADEYDVQDLFHALLRIDFDDIRAEDWCPNYAGGSSRVDFLLKADKIVVEVKRTRPGLGSRKVGEQLIVDIAKYQSHPDCSTLICFVYDPDNHIKNPVGLQRDLSKTHGDLDVVVLVVPTGT